MLDEVTAGAYAHLERRTALHDTHLGAGRHVPVGRPVEARRQLRLDRAGVPRRARGRRHHRRRHARQVPRLRARRRRVPRAPLPEPRRRHPAGAPALRPAARRARRDPRRRHDLPHRRRDLLPHGHDLGRRGGRGADDRLARHLGHDGAHRQPDLRARRDQHRRPEGARGALDADRGRHLAGGLPLPPPAHDHRRRASRASRSASASWARSAGSCTTPPRAPRSCGPRCWRPARRTASQPFGIQAQRLLRLEKGHIIVSQDTDFETTPWRVDMGWAVKLEKDWFVGKRALVRKQETPTEKLIAYRGESGSRKAPWEGAAVKVDGKLVGRVDELVVLLDARLLDRPRLGQARVRGRGPAPADRQGQHERERRQGRVLRPRGGEAPCLSSWEVTSAAKLRAFGPAGRARRAHGAGRRARGARRRRRGAVGRRGRARRRAARGAAVAARQRSATARAVVDHSDGYALFTLTGERARGALRAALEHPHPGRRRLRAGQLRRRPGAHLLRRRPPRGDRHERRRVVRRRPARARRAQPRARRSGAA